MDNGSALQSTTRVRFSWEPRLRLSVMRKLWPKSNAPPGRRRAMPSTRTTRRGGSDALFS